MLLTHGRSYTCESFARRAATLAATLAAAGVRRGERVATLLEEYDNFFVAMFAAWLAGAVLVPLNKSLPEPDVAWLLAKSQPRVLLTEDDRRPRGPARPGQPAPAPSPAPGADGPVRLRAVAAELAEQPLPPARAMQWRPTSSP